MFPKLRTELVLDASVACRSVNELEGSTMAELERYIPGVPCWVDLSSPDPEAALRFTRASSAGSSRT